MAPNKVIIAGGGLVGSLAACYFAKRGWVVEVYEKRPDPRDERNFGKRNLRSINLAISTRGLSAINRLDPKVEQQALDIVLPMYGRMIHDLDGTLHSQQYSVTGQPINSVDRGKLNEILLDVCESYPNTKIFFEHDTEAFDYVKKTVTVKDIKTNLVSTASGDLIVGADGAHSAARRYLSFFSRTSTEQTYIDHGYCEIEMKARDGDFAMKNDHLHIWPRNTFMLIALPNLDKSFTCTLFMPWSKFDSIKTDEDLMVFFRENFPDAIPLFGEELKKEYFTNPKGALFYVKCSPHHYKGNGVIVGDAAHCTVPFYAQGMNCGFEDIEVLDKLLVEQAAPLINAADPVACKDVKTNRLTSDQIEAALIAYSAVRPNDSANMIDLAMHNYIEMRSNVNNLGYKVRHWVEGKLYLIFPSLVIPLYTMVSFTKIPYSKAKKQWEKQTEAIHKVVSIAVRSAVYGALFLTIRRFGPQLNLRLPKMSEVLNLFRK